MPRRKNNFKNTKPEAMMAAHKTNPLNDNVKNTREQQNMGAVLNMPRGAKKPERTSK